MKLYLIRLHTAIDRESLKNLTPEQLVEMVLKLQELVVKQGETIEKLKGNRRC